MDRLEWTKAKKRKGEYLMIMGDHQWSAARADRGSRFAAWVHGVSAWVQDWTVVYTYRGHVVYVQGYNSLEKAEQRILHDLDKMGPWYKPKEVA